MHSVLICVTLCYQTIPGVVENLKIITRKQSLKIAQFAFNYAQKNNLNKVTAVHKANIMYGFFKRINILLHYIIHLNVSSCRKLADGLFLQCCREVSELYPGIEFTDMIVDNACMQVVSSN